MRRRFADFAFTGSAFYQCQCQPGIAGGGLGCCHWHQFMFRDIGWYGGACHCGYPPNGGHCRFGGQARGPHGHFLPRPFRGGPNGIVIIFIPRFRSCWRTVRLTRRRSIFRWHMSAFPGIGATSSRSSSSSSLPLEHFLPFFAWRRIFASCLRAFRDSPFRHASLLFFHGSFISSSSSEAATTGICASSAELILECDVSHHHATSKTSPWKFQRVLLLLLNFLSFDIEILTSSV